MRIYILILWCFAFTWADYECRNGTACNVNCFTTLCADAVIDASKATTATILCPHLGSCRNMTTICPIGNSSLCQVTCSDSLSCDHSTIHSQSASTTVNCISSNIDMTNICTNITINLPLIPNIRHTTIHCTSQFPFPSTVCDTITVTTNTTATTTPITTPLSSLSFLCQGSGIRCDSIDINAVHMATVKVVVDGASSNLHNSRFTVNNNLDIQMNDASSISMTSFIGQTMNDDSSVSVQISNGSASISNNFLFDGIASFQLFNPDVNDLNSSLLDHNKITITNSFGSAQTILISNINGDLTNNLTTPKATRFTLNCRNHQPLCGNLGTVNVDRVQDIVLFMDSGVHFRSIVNAQHVNGINITILEGGLLNGLSLDATYAEQLTLNVYGQTRGKNVIKAANALGFDFSCYNPKSCSDDLEIYTSPSRTRMHCIGTACDQMTLYVDNLANEVEFIMSDCPCYDERRNLCISEWNIKCFRADGTGFSKIINGECYGTCCGRIVDQLQETFANKYECPLSNETTYTCQENTDCFVECAKPEQYDKASAFNCSSNGVVDASMAKTLQLFCYQHDEFDASCSGLQVLAPKQVQNDDPHKFAQVSCTGNGCSGLRVDVMQTPNFYMDCLQDSICANISIVTSKHALNASITPTINIECYGGALCDTIGIIGGGAMVQYECTNSSCHDITIENERGYTIVNVTGAFANFTGAFMYGDALKLVANIHKGTMDNVTLNADRVYVHNEMGFINALKIEPNDTIHTVAIHNIGALHNSMIDARSARNLSVMCSSHLVDKMCENVSISAPIASDAVSSLLCVNDGCQNLTFYTVNDMNDMEVTLSECPCDSAVQNSCILSDNEWRIYCKSQQNEPSVLKENRCEGSCCGDIVRHLRVKHCDYGGKKQSDTGMIVAGICGGVLALLVIAGSVYFYKKRQSSQQVALLQVNE